jgi:hypothetical protein
MSSADETLRMGMGLYITSIRLPLPHRGFGAIHKS